MAISQVSDLIPEGFAWPIHAFEGLKLIETGYAKNAEEAAKFVSRNRRYEIVGENELAPEEAEELEEVGSLVPRFPFIHGFRIYRRHPVHPNSLLTALGCLLCTLAELDIRYKSRLRIRGSGEIHCLFIDPDLVNLDRQSARIQARYVREMGNRVAEYNGLLASIQDSPTFPVPRDMSDFVSDLQKRSVAA